MPLPLEQTPEQREAAFKAAGIPLPPTSIPNVTASSSITGNNLVPVNPPKVTVPTPTPVPDISNIPTAPITSATSSPTAPTNDFNTKLEELINKIAEKPIEEAARIGTATAPYEKQLNELNKQIKANQLQALTFKEKAEKMNVLTPFAQGDLERANRANALEALRLSALKEAAQGDIAFATKQAQLAIDTEFAPKQRELIAMRQNIINNYDSMTPAQKKRADITLATLNEKDAFVAREKSDREESFKIANTAAANSINFKPTSEYPTANSALQAIQSSSPQKALQIITETGLVKAPAAQSDFEQAFLREHKRLPTITELLDFKRKEAMAGREGKTTATLDILDIQRYNELYPEAGIVAGDTKANAEAKIAAINTPEAKTRALIIAAKNNNNSYEKVIAEIKRDTSIKDKEIATKIADEVYGKVPAVPAQPIYGKDNFAKVSLDEELTRLQADNLANGLPKNTGLREDLAKKGYPIKEVDKRLSPVSTAVSGFINSIENFLFK